MEYMKAIIASAAVASLAIFATASYAQESDDCIDMYSKDVHEPLECYKIQQDNGWGNGDDVAPGESLENNNAENRGGGPDNPNPNNMDDAPGNSGKDRNSG